MTVESGVRLVSGSVVLLSIATAHPKCPLFVSENMLFLGTLAAVMMVQSAFTGFCPGAIVLRKLGLKGAADGRSPTPSA